MAARRVEKWHRLDGSPLTLLLALVGTHAGIQVGTLGLAALRVPLSPAIALGLVLLSLLLGLVLSFSAPRHSPASPGGAAWLQALPALAVVVYCVLLARASTLPDYSWDGNTYHIPPINYWARAGYVHWVPVTPIQSELMNGYPKGAELLTWALTTLFHASRFVSLANFCFLPLGMVGIAQLCELLGTSRRMAWACGSLVAFIPVLLWQSVTSYVDCAFGCTAIAALALLCQVQDERDAGVCRWWRSIAALGSALGLLCAVKSSGLLLTTSGLFGLLAVTAWRAGSLRRTPWLGIVGAGAVCAGVGGYWYVRNYVHTGSPLFPVGISLAGHPVFPGRRISDVLDFAANTPAQYRPWPGVVRVGYAWAQGLTLWPNSSFGWDGRFGGLGFLWLAGCVPAVVTVAALRLRRLRKAKPDRHDEMYLLLALVVAAAFLGTPLNWWARYTVWIYALGLPCFGVVAERVFSASGKRALGRIWLGGVVALALFEGSLSVVQIVRNAEPGNGAAGRLPEVRTPAGEGCALFPEAEGTQLDAILLGRDSVGLAPLSGDTEKGLLIGSLSLPLGARDIVPISATTPPDFDQLRRRHVRYLIYDGEGARPRLPLGNVLSTEQAAGFWVVTLR